MLKFRNTLFLLLFFSLFAGGISPLLADDDDDFDDDELDFILDSIPPIDPNELIAISLSTIITKPLWEKTFIPLGRDVLYLMPYKVTALQQGGLIINIFVNVTPKIPLTFDSVFNAEGINVALDGVVKLLSATDNVHQIIGITPLLRKMTLQERKVGALFQAGLTKGPVIVQLNTSFQVAERNFWLSRRDRHEIREIVSHVFPGSESLDEGEFVRWNVGLGDSRLKLGLNLVNLSAFQMDIGMETIIPTSRISSSFKLQSEVSSDPNEFLGLLLKSIQQLVLNPRLGYGHFGLGIYVESKVSLKDDLYVIWNRLSFDNFFSGKEDRLILYKATIQPGQLTVNNLNEFLREYVFPPVFSVLVQPGSIINFVTGFDVNLDDFRIGFGYDYFFMRAETFEKIDNTPAGVDLLVDRATAPQASQHKVFSEFMYTKKFKGFDLLLGLGADTTIESKGIGRDWTVYGKIGFLF